VAGTQAGDVSILLGAGDGSFGSPASYAVGDSPWYVALGDIDGNGMIDFVSRWGTTYRLLQTGTTLSTPMRIRVLGAGGERNQQGRIVRIVPQGAPDRVMTRVIESGSGLQSQSQYDLLIGAPWPGTYDVSVRFAGGVVTGTVVGGTVATGEEVAILPGGTVAKVRGLQIHGGPVERASAGTRTAVNLQGMEKESAPRGSVLCHPGTFSPTKSAEVFVEYLQLVPKPLRHRGQSRESATQKARSSGESRGLGCRWT